MSYQVEFDQSGMPVQNSYDSPKPKMVQFVIDHSNGMVKNENQANLVLLGLFVVIVIISVVIFMVAGANSVPLTEPSLT